MLHRKHADGFAPWSMGSAAYYILHTEGLHGLPTAVRCKFGAHDEDVLVLLDTGAQFSVVGGSLLRAIEADLGPPLRSVPLSTRLGRVEGPLREVGVTIVADDGSSLELESKVVAAPSWDGPVVLGVAGLLELICFALEPRVAEDGGTFFFGRLDDGS